MELVKILNLFCERGNGAIALKKPFRYEKYLCASDGQVAIYIQADKFKEPLFDEKKLNLPSFYLPESENFELKLDSKVFLPFKTEEGFEEGYCTVCNGEGEVEWQHEEYTKYDDCPVCYGDKPKVPTGEKVFHREALVLYRELYFKMFLFYKLVEVSEILKQPILCTGFEKKSFKASFSIGDFKIQLMSTNYSAESVDSNKYPVLDLTNLKKH